MSSPDTFNNTVTFLGAGAQITSASFTQSGADQLNALDLTKDSNGAITLNSSNLQKMAAAKLLDYNGVTGQYSLNVTLMAPQLDSPTLTITPSYPSDGLHCISSTAQASTNLLSTATTVSSHIETTPLGALQLQAAAPTQSCENPYLQGKQAKLMILMNELLFIQSKIAVYDKDSSQKTFRRAIDNVQMQAAAIARKYDADDMRLRGDITAAQMTIGVDVLGMALQIGALTGIGLLEKTGKSSQSTTETNELSTDRLTLSKEQEQRANNQKSPRVNEERQVSSNFTAEGQKQARVPSELSQIKEREAVAEDNENSPLLKGPPSHMGDIDQEKRCDGQTLISEQKMVSSKSQEINPAESEVKSSLAPRGIDSQLTLTPERPTSDQAVSTKSSMLSDLARTGLNALLGENGLNNALEKMARNYVQIVHSTTNIGANDLSKVAEQSLTSIELQKSMIQQQLTANKDQSKKTSENMQSLLDLVSSLSRTSLENERTLFRG